MYLSSVFCVLSAEVAHEPSDKLTDSIRLLIELLETGLPDQAGVQSDIELRLDFTGRSFGDGEKPAELNASVPLESLRYIRHHRDCRASYLVPQSIIPRKRTGVGGGIHVSGKFARPSPGVDILKSFKGSHR